MASATTEDLKTELRTLVELHQLGGEVALTPRTTEAFDIAWAASEQEGTPFLDEWHETMENLNAFYGCMGFGTDIVRAVPATQDGPAEDRTQPANARFQLGGLSTQALRISDAYGRHVGVQDLWGADRDDVVWDRLWDGLGMDGPISLGSHQLSPSTQRWGDLGFAQGLRAWARSERYLGGLSEQDVTPSAECFARATGPYFPDGAMGSPDFTPPFIEFSAPPSARFVHGDVPVVVTASDPAGVVSFSLEAIDGLSVSLVDMEASPPRIEGGFNSREHADGTTATIVATSSDAIGNTGSKSIDIHILNSIPTPRVLLVPDDDVVSGRVNIGCDCGSDILVPKECSLVSPDPHAENIEAISVEPERVMYSWQTEEESEGPYTAICQASVAGFDRPAAQSRPITVDNIAASSYCGDAPADAQARVLSFLEPDDLISSAHVAADGAFCVEVDHPAAPIEIEISGRPAQIQRFAADQNTAMGNNTLALYLDHVPGEHIEGLTPDGVTSLAVGLCRGIRDAVDADAETDVAGLCNDVHEELNAYALAGESRVSDIRWVPMAPWGSDYPSAPRDTQYKLMWHAAADYLAAGIGKSWLDLATHGVDDARADALINGLDDTDVQMMIGRYVLSGMTFRLDLARAGLRLSRGVPVGDYQIDIPPGLSGEASVDHWAHLAGFSCDYFVPEAGEELDTDAPILTPDDVPQSLTGDVQICITMDDDSEVNDGGFWTDRDGVELEDITLQDGELCGTLRSTKYDDGDIAVTYWAVDANGARAEGSFDDLQITNNRPELLDLQTPCTLRGPQTVVEICAKHEHLDSMQVVRPTVLSQTFERQDGSDVGCLAVTMDPTSYAEGLLSLNIEAVGNGVPNSRPYECLVDNYDPGSLELCAFADTAIAAAEVDACWQREDSSCLPLSNASGLVTDDTGCVTIPLPDDQQGELHVRTRGGWYWSAVHRDGSGDPMRVYASNDLGVTGTYSYAPSRPAMVLSNRRASYATTWADGWGLARLNAETTPEHMTELLDEGYRRIGLHVGRDLQRDGIDVRTTTPRDLIHKTPHSSATSEASTRLGILQVSVAQCVAELSIANGSAPDALPSLSFATGHVLDDAQNGYYDGLNASGNHVTAMGRDLDHNTLRHPLMTCGALWLDSQNNTTSLRATNFSQPDGFFALASANQDAQLFGSRAGDVVEFDRTPPDLTATLVDQDLAPLPLDPVPVDHALILRISASDDGGFSGANGLIRPVVSIDPGPVDALGPGTLHGVSYTTIGVNYTIALDSLAEGEQTIEVSQADAMSNVTDAPPLVFFIDRTEPTVTPTIPDYTSTTSFEVSWSSNEPLSEVTVYGGASVLATVTGDATSATVDVSTCNASHNITLVAKDQAKNTATMPQPHVVVCDDRAPEFLNVSIPAHINSKQVRVSWTNTENMRSVSLLLDGSVVQTLDGNAEEATLSLPSCDDTYEIALQGVDLAGNDGDGPVQTVTCETIRPTFSEFLIPAGTKYPSVPATWLVSETLQQLEVIVNGAVVETFTDERTSHQVPLPACNADHTVQLRATDLAGNIGESEVAQVKCDDISPTILDHSVPERVAGTESLAEMLVSWSVSEAIAQILIRVGDTDRLIELNSSIDHVTVPLPRCNAAFSVTMRVYDFTGNGSDPVGPNVVGCDMYDPFVALVESRHFQENAATVTCGVDSCDVVSGNSTDPSVEIDLAEPGPHDIYHYKHRYCHGRDGMPVIKFQAADSGDVWTDNEALDVEYFYSSSYGHTFEAWRPVSREPGTSMSYKIDLSPDSLLPSIYDTTADELHTVAIRSRDESGRYSQEVTVEFRMHFLMPPVVLSNGDLSEDLRSRSLQDGTMHQFFPGRDSSEVLSMQVFWPWGHDNEPTHNAVVDLGAAEMSARISGLRQAKYPANEYHWLPDLESWSCGDSGHRFVAGECSRGLAAEGSRTISEPATTHSMLYEVEGAIHRGLNRYEIEPNRAYTIRVRARSPHVDLEGSPYGWEIRDGQYEADREVGEEYDRRRRVDDPDLEGEILELHLRTFQMQTYVSEVLVDVQPLTVDAHAGEHPANVVPAADHEDCIEAWSFTSSTH